MTDRTYLTLAIGAAIVLVTIFLVLTWSTQVR